MNGSPFTENRVQWFSSKNIRTRKLYLIWTNNPADQLTTTPCRHLLVNVYVRQIFQVDKKKSRHEPIKRGIYLVKHIPKYFHLCQLGNYGMAITMTLHGRRGVSNHRPLLHLFNILFRRTSKESPKPITTGFCEEHVDCYHKESVITCCPRQSPRWGDDLYNDYNNSSLLLRSPVGAIHGHSFILRVWNYK